MSDHVKSQLRRLSCHVQKLGPARHMKFPGRSWLVTMIQHDCNGQSEYDKSTRHTDDVEM